MSRAATAASRLFLALVLLLLVFAQAVTLPGLAQDSVARFPDAASVRTPVLVLAISALACVQVAVVSGLTLLTLLRRQRTVDAVATRYAGICAGALAAAATLVLAVGIYVSSRTGSPLYVLCTAVAMVGAGLAQLMVVVRGRLLPPARRAAARRNAVLATPA